MNSLSSASKSEFCLISNFDTLSGSEIDLINRRIQSKIGRSELLVFVLISWMSISAIARLFSSEIPSTRHISYTFYRLSNIKIQKRYPIFQNNNSNLH